MAEKFEVSRRTVSRDIEDLCRAGIPIVTAQGYGGGIALTEGFALDTTVFTKDELAAILAGLSSVDSVSQDDSVRQAAIKLDGDASGLSCSTCTYREPFSCGGCIETNGHPFHWDCPVAACCQSRGLVHCGQCPQVPCGLLISFSNDPEHGDDTPGDRIAACLRWREEELAAK